MRCFEQPSLHALFLASAAPLRSFPAWNQPPPNRSGQHAKQLGKKSGQGILRKQWRRGVGATDCAPGAARGLPPCLAELVGSGECAGDVQPRKKVGQAKCCQLLVGGAGERALLLRRAAAGGCAGAPNLKDEKSPDNCRPRNPRAFYQICARKRSRPFRPIFVGLEPLGTFGTQLCWC